MSIHDGWIKANSRFNDWIIPTRQVPSLNRNNQYAVVDGGDIVQTYSNYKEALNYAYEYEGDVSVVKLITQIKKKKLDI